MSGNDRIGGATVPGARADPAVPRAALGSFGAFLVGQGLVRQAQREEANQSRSVYGGRLGTNLVELGYLGLEELAAQLGAYHGVPLPPTEWLEAPDPKAMKLVPMALVRKLKVLPLHLDRGAIHVAMIDPRDADQLEFLATAASRAVVPYVLPEIRLLYWLEVHLQIDRHPRYVNLAARLRRTDMRVSGAGESDSHGEGDRRDEAADARPGAKAARVTPIAPPRAHAPELLEEWLAEDERRASESQLAIGTGASPPSNDSSDPSVHSQASDRAAETQDEVQGELLLEELFQETPAAPVATGGTLDQAPLRSSQVAELEARMDGAASSDDIVDVVLRLALNHCEATALFLVRGGVVRAFRAGGIAGAAVSLDGVEVPLHVHSIFSHPAVTGFPFRGSPPEGGIDSRLLAALERADIQELLVQPISIGGRVVNLLYCDNGASAFGETSIAALGALAHRAAVAYERLILDRKRQPQA